MRILAIESALSGGSVAALQQDQLLAETHLPPGRRTAQTLIPAIQDTLGHVSWRPRDVQLVAVTRGPGSFTSLRIGVTAAKTFAYAAGAELLGVNTLAAIAAHIPPGPAGLWVVLDAERQQLFASRFRFADDAWTESDPVQIVGAAAWIDSLSPGELVAGPALVRLAEQLPAGVHAAPQEQWFPQAAIVGRAAWRDYTRGARSDVWSLMPDYVRPAAAEEKLGRGPAA